MRRFPSTIRSLAGAAVLAAAALAGGTAPAQATEAGALGGANFFEHMNYGGASLPMSGSGGTCINLPADWHNRISSISNVWQRVHLYSLPNCWQESGHPDQLYTASTTYVGDRMNDRAKSIRIW
ncbi:hypothetical protein [Streptomyces sp. DH37]|uniref:hypothetical protein n=1 Tax=Streptomyces sp. DH37 TaxID=3040122 RepID=UPI0024415513|nr:hypothetical protein [Streptomyces sp. DH37]MDG9701952.1 hypothetical protein [Streptomyces sp. DH37]